LSFSSLRIVVLVPAPPLFENWNSGVLAPNKLPPPATGAVSAFWRRASSSSPIRNSP